MSRTLAHILLTILALNTLWFVLHSGALGVQALTAQDATRLSRVFLPSAPLANAALALHMVAGAALTVGAPLQALPVLRTRWPGVHRKLGYALGLLAVLTGGGGLAYIAMQGTIGGWWMSLWFAGYGAALIWAAVNTVYFALDKNRHAHRAWAVRLVILAVGSWIYRMHYVIWGALTGGAGTQPDFTGWFDQIQVWAFFVPYLLLAEIGLRRPSRPAPAG